MKHTFKYYRLMSNMSAAVAGMSFTGIIKAATMENTLLIIFNLLCMLSNIFFAKITNDIYETKVFMSIAEFMYDNKAEIEEAIKEKREHEHKHN